MFSRAIIRIPSKSVVNGLRATDLGPPLYKRALEQHSEYISALKKCGLGVIVLDPDEDFPDATFVEDTALLTPNVAIITNPGAPTRQGETKQIQSVLVDFFQSIEAIKHPGTLDGGDIVVHGNHYYIGLSNRTNDEGATQLTEILNTYGMLSSTVEVENGLHLKSSVAYLDNNYLVALEDYAILPQFQKFKILSIDTHERYASNCVWINGFVLVPKGFPKAKSTIEGAGYETIELDMSEFRKIDGGLSCLSLRF
jgi:dimethylargininase